MKANRALFAVVTLIVIGIVIFHLGSRARRLTSPMR